MGAAGSKPLAERIRERAALAHRPTLLERLLGSYVGWGVMGAAAAAAALLGVFARRRLKSLGDDKPAASEDAGPPVRPTKLEEVTAAWLDTIVPGAADAGGVASFASEPDGDDGHKLALTWGSGPELTPLTITTSADLSLDARFTVIVNSVSPEFQSSGSDSGINHAVWRTLSGFSGEGEKPAAIKYGQDGFVKRHGAAPT